MTKSPLSLIFATSTRLPSAPSTIWWFSLPFAMIKTAVVVHNNISRLLFASATTKSSVTSLLKISLFRDEILLLYQNFHIIPSSPRNLCILDTLLLEPLLNNYHQTYLYYWAIVVENTPGCAKRCTAEVEVPCLEGEEERTGVVEFLTPGRQSAGTQHQRLLDLLHQLVRDFLAGELIRRQLAVNVFSLCTNK